jgi:antitoxin MazE
MKLQVAKWGNSLAVRLPVEYVRAAGLQDGDSIEADVTPTGGISLIAARPFDKAAFLARIKRLHTKMPATEAVVEWMRREARY